MKRVLIALLCLPLLALFACQLEKLDDDPFFAVIASMIDGLEQALAEIEPDELEQLAQEIGVDSSELLDYYRNRFREHVRYALHDIDGKEVMLIDSEGGREFTLYAIQNGVAVLQGSWDDHSGRIESPVLFENGTILVVQHLEGHISHRHFRFEGEELVLYAILSHETGIENPHFYHRDRVGNRRMAEFTRITEAEFEWLRAELEGGDPAELDWRPVAEFGRQQ